MRASLQRLSPAHRAALLESLPAEAARALVHDWQLWARDKQLAPPGGWSTWLVLAGRGFGKTRTGAEWVRDRVAAGTARRIALVGATAGDVRDVMVEGESGLLAIAPPWDRPKYEPSKRRVTWKNGAVATLFSADEPDRLRGPQQDTAWADEIAAWRYATEAWDNLQFGLRLGALPQTCATTTPRPVPLVKDLLRDPTTVATRGTTYENAENLARAFLAKILAKYEGTRLGRQELRAELLEDTPGALWTLALLDANRVRQAPDLVRVVVAIDPQAADPKAAASDDDQGAETGIVAAGVDAGGQGYVLADESDSLSPAEWGERAVLLHDRLQADAIVAEVNQGGAMVEHVVRTAAADLHRRGERPSAHVAYVGVHAARGKHTRAEPIAALDAQHRVHHVGALAALESQMTTWVPGEKSPDRLDARVWALTHLMLDNGADDDASFTRAGRRR